MLSLVLVALVGGFSTTAGARTCNWNSSVKGSIAGRNIKCFKDDISDEQSKVYQLISLVLRCKTRCEQTEGCHSIDIAHSGKDLGFCCLGECTIGDPGCVNDKHSDWTHYDFHGCVDDSGAPVGFKAKFDYMKSGVKECRLRSNTRNLVFDSTLKVYFYDTGRCTACPSSWYQSCQSNTETLFGIKTTYTGYTLGHKYCGFLGCKMKCAVKFLDMGCGCNRPEPKDGWCAGDTTELRMKIDMNKRKVETDYKRRRLVESPVLEGLLAKIEGRPEVVATEDDVYKSVIDLSA